MAEAIILPLANSILKMIASLTVDHVIMNDDVDESKDLKSVKEDLKAIAEDLSSITSVLGDAEAKQYSNAALEIWLRDLKRVAYDIDDLLDEVATEVLQRSIDKGHIIPQLRYCLSLESPISQFNYFIQKIKDLHVELERIVVKKTEFGLIEQIVETPSAEGDVFDVSSYVDRIPIFAKDEAKNDIINKVMSVGNERSLSVLPIVGMGGIGKTAFAKLVYDDIDQFDCKLWLCVSDNFDLQKILKDILKKATSENTPSNSLDELVERVQGLIQGQKFFLVLDDLWEDDAILWKSLIDILGVGEKGSVVLITTRIEKVASITQTVEPYYLDKLSDWACWYIFKKLAFADGEEERYPKLEEIGISLAEKCCGNPLIAQSLGSLLRTERDEGEWLRLNNMDCLSQLDGQYDKVKQILKLSFDKLSAPLKSCFAHLSLFTKDTVYVKDCNLYYWSGLGLLQLQDRNYVGRNFFNELLSRFMLQDAQWNFNNEIAIFKMHDLLHDIAEDALGEEIAVVTRNKFSVTDLTRYISWGLTDLSDEEFPEKLIAKKARAFIFHYEMKNVSRSFLGGIISNMPYIRLLGLGSAQFEELPSSISDLKHLRVLNLSNNALIKSLPDSICELLNLECLLLDRCTQLEELPAEIYKLTSLKFLSLTTCQTSLVGTKFNRLPSLQHLWIMFCTRLVSLWDTDDVGSLTSLCGLRITDCPNLTSLPNSMKLLVGLEDLRIVNCEELELEIGEGLCGVQSLHTLGIIGVPRLSCLPDGLQTAASSLKYLWIGDCGGFTSLPNWLGSFASLQRLFVINCPNLLSLPEGICHLNSLQLLQIGSCPHLSRRCATPDGEDLSLIRHVQAIWLDGNRLTPT